MNTNKNFILYTATDGEVKLGVFISDETLWLSQKNMAELFDVSVSMINEYLKNIFNTEELNKESVIRNFRITTSDDKNYATNFYNLDAIIAVGYRANQFIESVNKFLDFNEYKILCKAVVGID